MARSPIEQMWLDKHFEQVERYRKTGQTVYSLVIASMPEEDRPRLTSLERLHQNAVLDASILDMLEGRDGA